MKRSPFIKHFIIIILLFFCFVWILICIDAKRVESGETGAKPLICIHQEKLYREDTGELKSETYQSIFYNITWTYSTLVENGKETGSVYLAECKLFGKFLIWDKSSFSETTFRIRQGLPSWLIR